LPTMTPEAPKESPPIDPLELKRLKKVYDELCYHHDKQKINVLLNPALARLALLNSREMSEMDQEEKDREIELLEFDIKNWKMDLADICKRDNQVIKAADVAASLKRLGAKTNKKDILEMIWEADEKLDNVIDWEEIQLNYQRNVHDASGLEPASFYNMVQFMIYDHNNNNRVSRDETMNMLYRRFGRKEMEKKLDLLFGELGEEAGKEGGEIDFTSYVKCVEKTAMELFRASELGQAIEAKGKRKVDPNLKKHKK